ncbi:hypothetical protein [Aquimarina macrocephali]|uniref:hypothetical protein n=1 Tax=Aquimarina macrocephali TaxID=666563 RepID=UPI00046627B6|nr:hypothetical protein [Aquimarina macrocephali]
MKKYVYSFPILKERIDEWLAFVETVNTSRNNEFTEMHNRIGVTKESWYLQKTSTGYDVVVYTESRDENFMVNFKNDKTEFSDWFRREVAKIQNIDLDTESVLPELVLDWSE